jgi:excisionase family DNA binding protein
MSIVYSPSEVAQVLRINEETVRRAIRNQKLSALHVGDQYRLSPSDLGKWLGMDRYIELFSPLEDARQALGSGGMNEAEADALALEAVHAVRENTIRLVESPAPATPKTGRKSALAKRKA